MSVINLGCLTQQSIQI